MKYNIWNAIAYEVTVMLINFDARWMNNKIVNMIRAHSFVDWCEWKTEQTMEVLTPRSKPCTCCGIGKMMTGVM